MPRVIPHPQAPGNPNWAILTDFVTGQHQLRTEHIRWLDRQADRIEHAANPPWVFVRGFASRLGDREYNERLSQRRAWSVVYHILGHPAIDLRRIQRLTGVASVGEEWSGGPDENDEDDDDSERWRAAEVIVTPHRIPGERPVPVPPPQRRVRRRVQCSLVGGAPQMRGFRGGDRGDRAARVTDWVMRNRSDDAVRQRLRCEFREIPVHHRIRRIKVQHVTHTSTWATQDNLIVHFEWGENAPDLVELQWHGTRRPTEHWTRPKVADLYRNVHLFLRDHDSSFN